MLGSVKMVYDRLPKEYLPFLKHLPNRFLFGKSYAQWGKRISLDKSQLNSNLAEALIYIKKHTAYGSEYLSDFEIHPRNSEEILSKLPIITSDDLANNLDYYISNEFNALNSYYTTTGGTGRSPTTILLSNQLYGIEWAHVHHIWALIGYERKKHLKLTLRGKSLKNGKIFEYNPVYNELVVDTFNIKRSNFPELLVALGQYNIKYIHGYPSLVKEYIEYFKEFGGTPNLRGIMLASEGVSVKEKEFMSQFFQCPVVSFYGQSERALLAADIDNSGRYKVYTSYGYPRVVDGELLVTSFVNRALPLVNYAIGDGAKIEEDDDGIYLSDLTGRWGKDFIFLDEHKKIPATAINLHSMIQDEILFYQIHQREFAKLEIRVLPKAQSSMKKEYLLRVFGNEMQQNLKDFSIQLRCVEDSEIIRSARGKRMLLIQMIQNN